MTKKKQTPGERISNDLPLPESAYTLIATRIDRAIRRAQAQAWDEGWMVGYDHGGMQHNPYRKAKR